MGAVSPIISKIFKPTENNLFNNAQKRYETSVIWVFIRKVREHIRRAVIANISITIVTLPILLSVYYEFPLYSMLLNLLVLPLMGILICDGMLSLLVGCMSVVLGRIVSFPTVCILRFYEETARFFTSLPYADIVTGKPESWRIVAYYTLLIVGIIIIGKIEKHRAKILSLCVCIMITVITVRVYTGLDIVMIDVGQGDGFFIRAPSGTTYLIDSGSTSKNNVGQYQVMPFLKYSGVGSVDYVFVTHPHEDHINAVSEMLAAKVNGTGGIRLKKLVIARSSKEDEGFVELTKLAKQAGTEVLYMERGGEVRDGKLIIKCLGPESDFYAEDLNEGSLVLALSYDGFNMLFTGDLTGEGEKLAEDSINKYMKETGISGFDVLKVAHHGSAYSSDDEFLRLVSPKMALISCGVKNSYNHPNPKLIGRLADLGIPYLISAKKGAVRIRVADGEYKTSHFLLDIK